MQIQAYFAAAITLKRLAAAFGLPIRAMLLSFPAQLGNLSPQVVQRQPGLASAAKLRLTVSTPLCPGQKAHFSTGSGH